MIKFICLVKGLCILGFYRPVTHKFSVWPVYYQDLISLNLKVSLVNMGNVMSVSQFMNFYACMISWDWENYNANYDRLIRLLTLNTVIWSIRLFIRFFLSWWCTLKHAHGRVSTKVTMEVLLIFHYLWFLLHIKKIIHLIWFTKGDDGSLIFVGHYH